MPPTSLVKFMQNRDGNGRGELHWGRADIDGAPFRGVVPTLPQEELDNRLTKIADPKNGIFKVSDPEQNKRYLEVLDKIANGWAQVVKRESEFLPDEKTWLMYIEWIEFYMEDGAPMQSQAPYMGRLNDG